MAAARIRRQSELRNASFTSSQSRRRPNHQMIATASSNSAANSKYLRYFPKLVPESPGLLGEEGNVFRLTKAERNHKILGGGARLQQFNGAGKFADCAVAEWRKTT